jgi:hypothetical protein
MNFLRMDALTSMLPFTTSTLWPGSLEFAWQAWPGFKKDKTAEEVK